MNLSRQSLLVLNTNLKIGIVGLGGIGSPTIMTLVKMGYNNIWAWEPDELEEPNVASGMFDSRKIGRPKVEAVQMLTLIASGVKLENLTAAEYDINATKLDLDILILAVDSFGARDEVYKAFLANGSTTRYLIDGRIGGHAMQVYTLDVTDEAAIGNWLEGLQREAPNLPCGTKATAYICMVVAGSICASVAAIGNGTIPFKCQIIEYDDHNVIFM
jgi:molybdopterin/thiamine biosynthesis adenylyltransferase